MSLVSSYDIFQPLDSVYQVVDAFRIPSVYVYVFRHVFHLRDVVLVEYAEEFLPPRYVPDYVAQGRAALVRYLAQKPRIALVKERVIGRRPREALVYPWLTRLGIY